MRWHHLVVLLVLLLVVAEAAAKKKKPNKPNKPNKPSKQKCPKDEINETQFRKLFHRYTVTTGQGKNIKPVANQTCWFNEKRNDCAMCKPDGQQCGAPMEKWCQSKKSKTGCPGINKYKYTKSSTGYPCYWKTESFDCAWCVNKNQVQCKDWKSSDPKKCGRHCGPENNLECDGVKTTCENIPKCGLGAICKKVGTAKSVTKKCKCKKGFSGNGFQCKDDETGEWAKDPNGEVEMTVETESKFWVYPQGSDLFPDL